ncbi:hypothetical protein D8674_012857 [Pyrus ussuriensis x Pyrus communis]|uniref:Uncharacterized protein n=1 Tax=Pyrus ussuriensis x Pyrus communis TaxID=2448454 RepID=A0A5N5GNX1_9ROSA|nr:hypothetical protein D8674_012857 [Pyrus ussuriensis x Pyrus communis]
MSQLIRRYKAVRTAPHSIHPHSTSAATAPAEMELRLVNSVDAADAIAPRVSQTSASSASSVALLVSAKHGFGNCYNFRGGSTKILMNYNFNDDMLAYVNRLFAERYKHLMIRRSLLRRVARRNLRTDKIIGCGSAIIFRSLAMWGFKIPGDLSLQTFMFDPGMSWPSPFILSDEGRGRIVRGWGMPGSANLEPIHHRSQRVR